MIFLIRIAINWSHTQMPQVLPSRLPTVFALKRLTSALRVVVSHLGISFETWIAMSFAKVSKPRSNPFLCTACEQMNVYIISISISIII